MLRIFFKKLFRNSLKYALHNLTGIVSMSMGFALVICATLFIKYEHSYDRHHNSNMAVLYTKFHLADKGYDNQPSFWDYRKNKSFNASTQYSVPFVDLVKESIPGFEKSIIFNYSYFTYSVDETEYTGFGAFVSGNFFEAFNYRFISGTGDLSKPNNVVLSAAKSKELFGTTESIGKVFKVQDDAYVVTGVCETANNTVLTLPMFLPYEGSFVQSIFKDYPGFGNSLLLYDQDLVDLEVSSALLREKYLELKGEKIVQRLRDSNNLNDENPAFGAVPLSDIYLNPYISIQNTSSSKLYSFIALVTGILFLIMGCANFLSVRLVNFKNRIREIYIKSALGQTKNSIYRDLVLESILLAAIACLFGGVLSYYLIQEVSDITNRDLLKFGGLSSLLFMSTIIQLTVIGALIIFYLYSTKLRLFVRSTNHQGKAKSSFMKFALFLQFSLGFFFLFGAYAIYDQLEFTSSMNKGFLHEESLYRLKGMKSFGLSGADYRQMLLMKEALSRSPLVENSTLMDELFTREFSGKIKVNGENKPFRQIGIDDEFFKTIGLDYDMIAGGNLDQASQEVTFVNRAYFDMISQDSLLLKKELPKLSGVVENFNFGSLKDEVLPLKLVQNRLDTLNELWATIKPALVEEATAFINKTADEIGVESKVELVPLTSINASRYSAEQDMLAILKTCMIYMLIIFIMGFVAITTLTIANRDKEIVIRRILGGNVLNMIRILFKSLSWPLYAGVLLALPLAYYLANEWIENNFAFYNKSSLGVGLLLFCVCLVIVFLLVWLLTKNKLSKSPVVALREITE